jgi:glycosyltransferase involved in cell wall biosynthesis
VLEALLAARGADHIIFGHAHLSPLALAISGGQRWAMAHGIEVWEKMTWLRRLGLLRMDRLLCVSRYTRDRMVHEQAIDPGRVVLFPDTARSREGASAFPQEALGLGKAKVILAVTRLWPEERYKKIDLLIEAMPSVLRSVPEALLVIVGEGADRPRLERTVQESGLSGHVRFTGKIPDDRLSSFYDACDLFALPSLGEGFGIVFLEAMAHGKPCIGAQAGAVPEVIQDGRTGLLVRPDDAGALAEALIRLLQNEDLRQAMGQAGRRRFLSEFSFDRFKERLARLTEPPA